MEDPRWLRLITIGLILSTLAVGYFLLTGRFTSNKTSKSISSPQPTQQTQTSRPNPSPAVLSASTEPTNRQSAPSVAGQTKGGTSVSTLPNTGSPIALAIIFASAAIVSGWGLRKYPN